TSSLSCEGAPHHGSAGAQCTHLDVTDRHVDTSSVAYVHVDGQVEPERLTRIGSAVEEAFTLVPGRAAVNLEPGAGSDGDNQFTATCCYGGASGCSRRSCVDAGCCCSDGGHGHVDGLVLQQVDCLLQRLVAVERHVQDAPAACRYRGIRDRCRPWQHVAVDAYGGAWRVAEDADEHGARLCVHSCTATSRAQLV